MGEGDRMTFGRIGFSIITSTNRFYIIIYINDYGTCSTRLYIFFTMEPFSQNVSIRSIHSDH